MTTVSLKVQTYILMHRMHRDATNLFGSQTPVRKAIAREIDIAYAGLSSDEKIDAERMLMVNKLGW